MRRFSFIFGDEFTEWPVCSVQGCFETYEEEAPDCRNSDHWYVQTLPYYVLEIKSKYDALEATMIGFLEYLTKPFSGSA